MTTDDHQRYDEMVASLAQLPSLLVAYSGGVDSTLLALAAHQALDTRSLAVTAVSPSLASEDRQRASRVARQHGFSHREVPTAELERPDYVANGPDRCFHCKTELFEQLASLAQKEGWAAIAYGAIPEDRQDYRPGERAAQQAGALAPLAEAGLSKDAVRRLSRHFGLETWDLQAGACLSSRISYHSPVTAAKLSMIERAEELLKEQGFPACRVRHHEGLARLEVPRDRLADLLACAERVESELRELGFLYVTMDLGGLRSGSMNRGLRVIS